MNVAKNIVEQPVKPAEPACETLDLPPEYCHYQDEGCALATSCLTCPLPRCADEEPGGRQRWLKTQRDRQIARLYAAQGVTVSDLAQMFSVSQRTVQRALKKNSKEIRNG